MPNPIVHFELASNDAERDKKFYTDLFGWQMEDSGVPYYSTIKTGGGGIEGGMFGIGEVACCEPYMTIYISVDNMAETLARASELGGQVIVQPQSVPGGSFALILDLDKNMIGLWETAK